MESPALGLAKASMRLPISCRLARVPLPEIERAWQNLAMRERGSWNREGTRREGGSEHQDPEKVGFLVTSIGPAAYRRASCGLVGAHPQGLSGSLGHTRHDRSHALAPAWLLVPSAPECDQATPGRDPEVALEGRCPIQLSYRRVRIARRGDHP